MAHAPHSPHSPSALIAELIEHNKDCYSAFLGRSAYWAAEFVVDALLPIPDMPEQPRWALMTDVQDTINGLTPKVDHTIDGRRITFVIDNADVAHLAVNGETVATFDASLVEG